MEKLLAPVLAAMNKHRRFEAKLDCFMENFGGGEALRVGNIAESHLQWYGTRGFAFLFHGLERGTCGEPPRSIGFAAGRNGRPRVVFESSALIVPTVFSLGGAESREYVVVCNDVDRALRRQRTLFCALLRKVVERMAKK